jgi:GNAT superfamily N-acetyltransferase
MHHPLLDFLTAAADGTFPAVDGGVTVMPPLAGGWECSVAFTGHAVVATARSAEEVGQRTPDGFGGSMAPDFLRWLAGPQGFIGVIDVMLVRRGTGTPTLPIRTDSDDHPRVQYARQYRSDVTVYGDERGLVTIGAGLAGRRELSVEASVQGRGWGSALVAEAVGLVPAGELLFAAVSPGNARSLRAFLGLGFKPIGSEVLIRRGDLQYDRRLKRGS